MTEPEGDRGNSDEVFGGEALCPPETFGIVEPGLYRSNVPVASNFTFIKLLKLRSVMLLSAEVPTRVVSTFFEENGVVVRHLGLKSWRPEVSWKPMSEEMVKEALEFVLDVRNHPIVICDTSGIHLVGTLVGCLRRLQNWNLNSIVNEYRSFAGSKTRYFSEQFFELFDVDLITLPEHLPDWLVEQNRINATELAEFEELIRRNELGSDGEMVRSFPNVFAGSTAARKFPANVGNRRGSFHRLSTEACVPSAVQPENTNSSRAGKCRIISATTTLAGSY